MIGVVYDVCLLFFHRESETSAYFSFSAQNRVRALVCQLCRVYYQDPRFVVRASKMVDLIVGDVVAGYPSSCANGVSIDVVINHIFPHVSHEFICKHVIKVILSGIVELAKCRKEHPGSSRAFSIISNLLLRIADMRSPYFVWSTSINRIENTRVHPPSYKFARSVLAVCEGELSVLADLSLQILIGCVQSKSDDTEELMKGVLVIDYLRWIGAVHPTLFETSNLRQKLHDLFTAVHLWKADELLGPEYEDCSERVYFYVNFCAKMYTTVALVSKLENIKCSSEGFVRACLERFLLTPESIVVLWGTVHMLENSPHIDLEECLPHGINIASESHEYVGSLCQCLRSSSHWSRYLALRLAAFLPLPVISSSSNGEEPVQVDVVGHLLEATTMPISLATEREYSRVMGKVEVLLRGNQLPQTFIDISRATCLGLLQTKFRPFWEPAMKCILADKENTASNDSFWSLLLRSIESLDRRYLQSNGMVSVLGKEEDSFEEGGKGVGKEDSLSVLSLLIQRDNGWKCLKQEIAESCVFFLKVSSNDEEKGEKYVYPDARLDCEMVYKNMFDILKMCPAITLRRSKIIVPMFLRFLDEQYYTVLSGDQVILLKAIYFNRLCLILYILSDCIFIGSSGPRAIGFTVKFRWLSELLPVPSPDSHFKEATRNVSSDFCGSDESSSTLQTQPPLLLLHYNDVSPGDKYLQIMFGMYSHIQTSFCGPLQG